MPKSIFEPKIMKILEDGPISYGTLKSKMSNNDIRKTMHSLLKNGKIEINGYDQECKLFAEKCMMIKKVDVQYNNPICIKGLLDKPLDGNNYSEIQKIFSNRIKMINQIYHTEIKELRDHTEEILLKEALKLGYFNPEKIFRSYKEFHTSNPEKEKGVVKKLTLNDVIKEDPDAKLFYLTKKFNSKLAISYAPNKIKSNIYTSPKRIEYNGLHGSFNSFVDIYKEFFNHLPINMWGEQKLFRYMVIGALKEPEDKKDDLLWELASDLAEDNLTLSVQKLRVLDYISETYVDDLDELRF